MFNRLKALWYVARGKPTCYRTHFRYPVVCGKGTKDIDCTWTKKGNGRKAYWEIQKDSSGWYAELFAPNHKALLPSRYYQRKCDLISMIEHTRRYAAEAEIREV